jgi:hypothetical protein
MGDTWRLTDILCRHALCTLGMSEAEERTATAEGALRAEPLALGQALGLLSDAAQVVGGRAAVAAQQAAALVAQAAVVRIAICLHSDLLALAQQSDSSQMCILQCMAHNMPPWKTWKALLAPMSSNHT